MTSVHRRCRSCRWSRNRSTPPHEAGDLSTVENCGPFGCTEVHDHRSGGDAKRCVLPRNRSGKFAGLDVYTRPQPSRFGRKSARGVGANPTAIGAIHRCDAHATCLSTPRDGFHADLHLYVVTPFHDHPRLHDRAGDQLGGTVMWRGPGRSSSRCCRSSSRRWSDRWFCSGWSIARGIHRDVRTSMARGERSDALSLKASRPG